MSQDNKYEDEADTACTSRPSEERIQQGDEQVDHEDESEIKAALEGDNVRKLPYRTPAVFRVALGPFQSEASLWYNLRAALDRLR